MTAVQDTSASEGTEECTRSFFVVRFVSVNTLAFYRDLTRSDLDVRFFGSNSFPALFLELRVSRLRLLGQCCVSRHAIRMAGDLNSCGAKEPCHHRFLYDAEKQNITQSSSC